mmetsp:Transcript_4970/g.12076  ORF Transcript_4970/g.12076 Transcript_4970/m.12076 type:complete len:266 (+) Transcript_4970:63-860(+)
MADAREQPIVAVVERSCKNVPGDIRLGFVKKVYGILTAMLVVSFAIASPFVFNEHETMEFMDKNAWICAIVLGVLLLHQIVNIAMCFESCCGGGPCMDTYLKMFVTVPWNYIFCMSYAACFGVVLGFICSQYTAQSVSFIFILTAIIMMALTIYAIRTNADFTGCGAYVLAALVGLLLLCFLSIFLPHNSFVEKAIAAIGAVVMSFVIIYDTQLIFGDANLQVGRSPTRKIQFTIDMYCFAAYQLYLDFVNLLLYLLELFGDRRN